MAMTKTARFGLIAGLVPLAMLGAAYAAVPLYQLFCQVTGYGGTTQVATEAASQVLSRTIQVRFDANVAPGVPWSFKPEKPVVSLKLGENGLAFYTESRFTSASFTVSSPWVWPHRLALAQSLYRLLQKTCKTGSLLLLHRRYDR